MKLVTNDLHIDNIIATWLAANSYTGYKPGKYISATTLLKSTQQQVLQLRAQNNEDVVQVIDISTLLKSRIGTAIHADIQQCWENPQIRIPALKTLGIPNELIAKIDVNPAIPNEEHVNLYFEHREEKEFKGWTISGQFDLVVGDTLHDFKSTSTYTYIHKIKDQDYIEQGSIYRWLNPDLIKDDLDILVWFNQVLIKAMEWQEDPVIAHDEVKLGGDLEIFWPDWSHGIEIPNNASKEEIIRILQNEVSNK